MIKIAESQLRYFVRDEIKKSFAKKQKLNESIVDFPTDKLSDVFDESGKLKKEIVDTISDARNKINKYLAKKFPFDRLSVGKTFVVGGAVTFQYGPTSDIDVTMIIPGAKRYQLQSVDKWIQYNLKYPNWQVDGSDRPWQFKPSWSDKYYRNVDAAYDPFAQNWLKKPDTARIKDAYEKIIADPESRERKVYLAIEKVIRPSLERLRDSLEESISNGLTSQTKKFIYRAFSRYRIIRQKRWDAYGENPDMIGRISQNWGTGNVVYKFLDRKGYSDLYADLRSTLIADFSNADLAFLKKIQTKLQNILSKPVGYQG